MVGRSRRAVVRIDPRNDLVAQVRVVVPGPGRVQELASAEGGPAVDPDHDARRRLARREHLVGQLGEVLPEGGSVPPHVELTGEPLDLIDARVASTGIVVVARRKIDPERADTRIADRIPLKSFALEPVLFEPTLEFDRPRQQWTPFGSSCRQTTSRGP